VDGLRLGRVSNLESEASFVSETSLNRPAAQPSPAGSSAVGPYKNPSYPARIHFDERAALLESLRSREARIQTVRQRLDTLTNHPQRAAYVRVYHQMLGARDQLADTVRRLPLETGELYHEDHERYQIALAAFDRVAGRWETVG
jgi:hypothetical protein